MSTDATPAAHSIDPDAVAASASASQTARPVRIARAAVLFISGLAITFTATMHEQLTFDISIAGVVLALIGILHLVEVGAARPGQRSALTILLGIAALAGAVLLFLGTSVLGFALVLAAWGLVSGLLEFIRGVTGSAERQDTTLLGALGLLFAVLVLLVREDPVAILGFLGAYAIIAGVFLGISAFDSRRHAHPGAPAPAAQG